MTSDKPKYQWLSTTLLKIDESYQRAVDPGRVKEMAAALDWASFGALTVFHRGQNGYFIGGGRHRFEAAIKAGERKVPCLVYESKGPAYEAEIFRRMGTDVRLISSQVNFRAGLVAKDPRCVEVKRVVEQFGFTISLSKESKGNGKPKIGCVNTLLKLHRRGATMLTRTLAVIAKSWEHNAEATRNEIIHGLFMFLEKYGNAVDPERLAAALEKENPADLAKGSKYVSKMKGGSRHQAITDAILQAYNSSPGQKLKSD